METEENSKEKRDMKWSGWPRAVFYLGHILSPDSSVVPNQPKVVRVLSKTKENIYILYDI